MRWQAANVSTVGIDLIADGTTWNTLVPCTAAGAGERAITTPHTPNETARVRVRAGSGACPDPGTQRDTDTSTHPFAIRAEVGNRAPVIRELAATPAEATRSRVPVTLQVRAEDPDGDSLSYRWRQVSGPAVLDPGPVDGDTFTFRTPSFTRPEDLRFEVTVSDAPSRGSAAAGATGLVTLALAGRTPEVYSVSRTCGGIGAQVVIDGGLLEDALVYFNGVRASPGIRTSRRIATYVPTGATSGPVVVRAPWGTETTAVPHFEVARAEIEHVRVTQGVAHYPLVWGKQTLVQALPRTAPGSGCRAEISGGTLQVIGAGGATRPVMPTVGSGAGVLQPAMVERVAETMNRGVHFQVPWELMNSPLGDFSGYAIRLLHNGEEVANLAVPRSALPQFRDPRQPVHLQRCGAGGPTAGGEGVGIACVDGHEALVLNSGISGRLLAHEVGHNYGLVASDAANHDDSNDGHSRYDEGRDCNLSLTFNRAQWDQARTWSPVYNVDRLIQFSSSPFAGCSMQGKSVMSYAPGRNNDNTFLELVDYRWLLRRAGGSAQAGALAAGGVAGGATVAGEAVADGPVAQAGGAAGGSNQELILFSTISKPLPLCLGRRREGAGCLGPQAQLPG